MRRFIWVVLAALVAVALLVRCARPPDPPSFITRTASQVDGFELRHTGFGDRRLHPGNFSLAYAIQAGYPYLVYRGETYRRAGPGSVFVRPAQGVKPRYLVEETPAEPIREYGDTASRLVVTDTTTGEIIAHRHLRMGHIENGHGWAGQHAAAFLHKVLLAAEPPRAPSEVATANIEVLEEGVAAPPERTGANCPSAWTVDRRRTHAALDTGAWVFVPGGDMGSFACDGAFILVESGNGFELNLDLLTTGGEHLFSIGLRGKLDLYAKNMLTRLRVDQNEMAFDFVHAPFRERGENAPPARLLRARVALPPGAIRAPSAKLAVK